METLPLPTEITSPVDARAAVSAITSDPRILQLVEAFSGQELIGLQRHLRTAAREMTDSERQQTEKIAAGWQEIIDHPDEMYEPVANLSERAAVLARYVKPRWDFRLGSERTKIPTSTELFPLATVELIYSLADEWGLRAPQPTTGYFDAVALLGGLVRANLNRPAAAAALIHDGTISTDHVIGLAGERALADDEPEIARVMGVPGVTEKDSLAYGIASAFGFPIDAWEGDWPMKSYRASSGLEFRVIAVSAEPGRPRATTATLWKELLDGTDLALSNPEHRVLGINTPIYWIAGHIDALVAVQRLGARTEVVTAGGSVDVIPQDMQQIYRSQHYLQEIKAAIDNLPKLLEWAESAEE